MSDFKPMLAAKTTGADVEFLKFPLLCSPKLDGIRCIGMNGVAMSRSLKPIPNKYVQKCFADFHGTNGLDGELIVGSPGASDAFNVTQSAIMTMEGKPDFTFHVFDSISPPNTKFIDRLYTAHKAVEKIPMCEAVVHSFVANDSELSRLEEQFLSDGFEGIMGRDPNGYYKYGRSTLKQQWLLKLKRFEDSEALILGVVEKLTNTNEKTKDALGHSVRSSKKAGMVAAGTMGALQVRDVKTGVEFEIGTGFTDEQRTWFWKHRKHVVENKELMKYRFQPIGVKDKPRFPSALGLRSRLDL